MGIYINMEMPKERESFTLTIKYNGLVFDTETGIQVAEAQEVPPHGRLIDADKMAEEIWNIMIFPSNLANAQFFVNTLREAPTIIPAKEGE